MSFFHFMLIISFSCSYRVTLLEAFFEVMTRISSKISNSGWETINSDFSNLIMFDENKNVHTSHLLQDGQKRNVKCDTIENKADI